MDKSLVLIFLVLLASFPLILVQQLLLLLLILLYFFHQKQRRGIDLHLPGKVSDFGLTSVCNQPQFFFFKNTANCKQVTRGKYGLFCQLYPEQEIGWTAMAANSK